jgi:hypothetical protein
MPFDPDAFLETPVATEPPYIPEGVKPPSVAPAFDPDAFLSTPTPTYLKTKPEKQPGNYVTDILKGVARGTETAIGYAVGQPMIAMGSMGIQDIDKF